MYNMCTRRLGSSVRSYSISILMACDNRNLTSSAVGFFGGGGQFPYDNLTMIHGDLFLYDWRFHEERETVTHDVHVHLYCIQSTGMRG